MIEVRETTRFRQWLDKLCDENARRRIVVRIRRLSEGNFGDAKYVGDGVGELRIDYGPGYRLYFARRGPDLVLLLAGGDKRTQWSDVEAARSMARTVTE
jgi:putative addiction module killer protein